MKTERKKWKERNNYKINMNKKYKIMARDEQRNIPETLLLTFVFIQSVALTEQ